ncbi:hydroxyglutarate oxidase [Fulvitalea axinellae]|uniref:Hydroxyglutarate oxidase n=1 Tax=Fulvitalea axinellae TaxID=1182444 RepID=A0AAU9CQP6_9BACT|nr:hydroxyglutarate oxidase [Fulvitalea axinellae]
MTYDISIIGGGIVGLATAYKILSQNPNLKLLLIEKEKELGAHQTGNNSGVIHSGLYYKPGSLKATNCIRGYHELVDFCKKEEIPFELCGKLVVSTAQEQIPLMNNLLERGTANGLKGIKRLNKEELKEHEPHVSGIEGLWVPQTGIVDYSVVCEKLGQKVQQLGGEIKMGSKVTNITTAKVASTIETSTGDYQTKLVVNCAGLYSDKVAEMTMGKKLNLRIIPFKGEYYKLKPESESLVKNLIYPVPDPNFPFLGVHFTRMMKGGVEAGPNAVLAFAREGYKKTQINFAELFETLTWPGFQKVASKYWKTGMGEMYRSFSKKAFTKALQGLIPEITEKDLVAGGAGIRAQACEKDGGLVDDFLIFENEFAVNVCNAPSPAATSALSIGQTLSEKILTRF